MSKLRVGVLRGGPSNEYEVSLKTGSALLRALSPEKYEPIDIFIDRTGTWHVRGVPREPSRALSGIDVVVNGLHGKYGEDGEVQNLLEGLRVPYTGSTAIPSRLAMNKRASKERLSELSIRLPKHVSIVVGPSMESELIGVFRSMPLPLVVKPKDSGSSVGVSLARSFHELEDAVASAFEHSNEVLIEEYIRGKEATVGVIDQFRDEDLYTLLPIEIIPPRERSFFDYDAKYTGITKEICPGNFTSEEREALQRAAGEVHQMLGLRHYSRSDFIVSPKGIYFLEANTLPGLTEESLVPKALTAVGSTLPEFVDHLVTLAQERG